MKYEKSVFIWIQYEYLWAFCTMLQHIDGLVQERRNSIANAMELRLSCTHPLTYMNIKGELQAAFCEYLEKVDHSYNKTQFMSVDIQHCAPTHNKLMFIY